MRKRIKISVTKLDDNHYQYKGIDIESNDILFKNTLQDVTEGIAEYIGAVHGLMYTKKQDINADVYVNNPYIKECIENKNYKHKAKGEKAQEALRKCNMYLLDQRMGVTVYLLNPSTDGQVDDVSEKFSKRKTWFND